MITVNLYYTGTNGNARKFAEEMESSGTADQIRNEEGNARYEYFFPMKDPEILYRDGYVFCRSVNGVWLIKAVPVKYMEKM